MVDMSHHGDHRRPRPEIFRTILIVNEAFPTVGHSSLNTIPEALGQGRSFVKVNHRIDRRHNAQLHQSPNNLGRARVHLLPELFHRHRLAQSQKFLSRSFSDGWCLNRVGYCEGFDDGR